MLKVRKENMMAPLYGEPVSTKGFSGLKKLFIPFMLNVNALHLS
jgi:hypothetical protein